LRPFGAAWTRNGVSPPPPLPPRAGLLLRTGSRRQRIHGASEIFKMALLICKIFSARGKNKNILGGLVDFFARARGWGNQLYGL
jgi:hypothetical protein